VSEATAATLTATILVVDDDPGVRTVVALVLRRAGCQVLTAENGREAVDAVAEHGDRIDAVLLDIMMPVMDGHEALAAMRGRYPDLPVVLFSGFDRNEVAEHLSDPQAYTSFVPKPFRNEDLIAELCRAVDSR
jgi:CheY-like chemotaxis protein